MGDDVDHRLVAVLVGIGDMEHEQRLVLEPDRSPAVTRQEDDRGAEFRPVRERFAEWAQPQGDRDGSVDENAGPAFGGRLTRLRINRRTTGVRRELLNDRGCEFPQLDPEIYREMLRRLDCAGPEVVNIDDFAENLPPAAALGMTTIEFTGPRELRETLAGLGVEVSP